MKDEGSIHDAAAKGKATAQSFSSLMKVTEEKTEAEKEALRVRYNEQTIKYRDQIRRQRRCTLDPHSKWMSRWDMVTTLALLFTATITPFEVCILEAMSLEEMLYDPLAWINRLVDAVFITDVFLNCMMSFQDSSAEGGASWVYDNQRILMHYVKSWMILDIITAFPIDLVTAAFTPSSSAAEVMSGEWKDDDAADSTSMLSLIRMIRLVKLGRVVKASRVFRRWEHSLGVSYSLIALIQFSCLVIFLAHWLACVWVLVGRSHFHTLSDGKNGAFWEDPHAAFGRNWVDKAKLTDATPRQLYGVAIYIAFSNIFSGSSGTIVPASPLEYYTQAVMMLIGSSVWAYVISNGVAIFATLNPNGVHYRQMMDELNFFARDKRLPKEMLVKLRMFFSQTQHVHRQSRYDVLLDSMSSRLKADAALCWAKSTLMRVPYFTNEGRWKIEDEFLASAALTLKTRIFCRSEYIPVDSLCIIERGIAAKNGRIKTKGNVLGEDMVLSQDTFRDLDPAVALTFVVQVGTIDKKHLETLMKDFPLARKKIRIATFRIAFCRAMISIAHACTVAIHHTGQRIDMIEALSRVRADKLQQFPRLREPTKRVLASTLSTLSERVEAIHEETRESIHQLQKGVDQQMAQILSRLEQIAAGGGGGGRSGDVERPPQQLRRKKQWAGAKPGAASFSAKPAAGASSSSSTTMATASDGFQPRRATMPARAKTTSLLRSGPNTMKLPEDVESEDSDAASMQA